MTPEQEVRAVIESIDRWLPGHLDSTVAVLVPRNARGTDVVQALKQTGIEFVELLGSTYSTRLTAARLADVTGILADPQSPARLAKAYLAWSLAEGQEKNSEFQIRTAGVISTCRTVESYVNPVGRQDWLEEISSEAGPEVKVELKKFREQISRWQSAVFLPIDQLILALAQDLFTSVIDLAAAHRLAQVLRQINADQPDWGLPEMIAEIVLIAHNERKFLGFSEDDSGFDPSRHPGKVIVTTIHKAKGLEWDRVYLMSVNNYDFPSNHPSDRFISEKWFLRGGLNLDAESLAQLDASVTSDEFHTYIEGAATASARLDYVRERLRLFFVGLTRAKRELVITWNTGRKGDQTPSIPFQYLIEWWQQFTGEK
jgi:DNA helicase-2/ATP-dependent DNA helicase PcrA